MKHILIAAVALLTACNSNPITTLQNQEITTDSQDTSIKLNYPVASNSKYPQTADSINQYVANALAEMPQNRDSTMFTLQKMMRWNAALNNNVVQLELQSYVFTGGAHGMSNLSVALFNNTTGARINPTSFISDTAKMLDFVRTKLLEGQVMLFDTVNMPMPKNIAFDSTAVVAIYNQYEIAPYSYGILAIRIPYNDIPNLVDTTFIKPSTLNVIQCPTKE